MHRTTVLASRPTIDSSTTSAPASALDGIVEATPPTRDRYIDLIRGLCIAVVVLWHWVFSITHLNDDGRLTMPNPIGDVPLLWLATWVLQVMPVFFVVGGFSNHLGLRAARRDGVSGPRFVRSRLARLTRPVLPLLALWAGWEVLRSVFWPGTPTVTHWGMVVFVPLWFIGAYAAVISLAPLTHRLFDRYGLRSVAALGVGVLVVDWLRLGAGVEAMGIVNSLLVWVFAHQLGYAWGAGHLDRIRRQWLLVGLGLVGLIVLTNIGVYPRSAVAVRGEAMASGVGSNMAPATAVIAALAMFQTGLALRLRAPAQRWLQRREVWKRVVAVNAVAMTVFTWHMTALVAALGVLAVAGFSLGAEPTATWWLARPVFLALPALLLAPLVAVFARVELRRMGPGPSAPVVTADEDADGEHHPGQQACCKNDDQYGNVVGRDMSETLHGTERYRVTGVLEIPRRGA